MRLNNHSTVNWSNRCDTKSNTPPEWHSANLKDFDLAGSRVKVLCVLFTVALGERVKLYPEGNALLSTVLPGSELCADAVHLQTRARVPSIYMCVLCGHSAARPVYGTQESWSLCVLPAQKQKFFCSSPTRTLLRWAGRGEFLAPRFPLTWGYLSHTNGYLNFK